MTEKMTMEENVKVKYIGLDNEVTTLKTGDIGTILLDYEDGFFEVEFLNSDGTVRVLEVIDKELLKVIK